MVKQVARLQALSLPLPLGGMMPTTIYPRRSVIRRSGPYKAQSRSDGTILLVPAWPQFRPHTDEGGGGPGVLSRLRLAEALELLLNGRDK